MAYCTADLEYNAGMNRFTFPLAALCLAAPLAARAQSPETDALLAKVGEAYKGLSALSFTLESAQAARKTTTKLLVTKSGKLTAEIVNATLTRHVIADGTTVYSDSSKTPNKYVKEPGTSLKQSLAVVTRNTGTGIGLLPILLTSPDAAKEIIPGKPSSVTIQPDETVDGVSCDVLAATLGSEAKSTVYAFAFGKEDHLLRRLTFGPATPGANPTVTETYSSVSLTPTLDDKTFVYTPAPNAVAVDPPKAPAYFDERLKVGADPFPLVGVDLAGEKVSYADYKGKVLLVDFWATWCGPCVAELPNVLESYARFHEQGFEILGISLDQDTARGKLEKFIKDRNMPWRQIYDGKYWEAENAKLYGVRSIPFTLLIGKDGKIAAVGARGAALAPAIEKALKQ